MSTAPFNFERDNVTGNNHDGPNYNTPIKVLTANSIIGDDVENLNGEILGSIYDIMINLEKGEIEYIILSYGGVIGVGDKLFAIPFNALKINPSKKNFILDRDLEYLKNAPGFDQTQWPESNSHYLNTTKDYWLNTNGLNGSNGPDMNSYIIP